jgi:capsular polysaccharide export protein
LKKPEAVLLDCLPAVVYALDFSFWKKPIVQSFLQNSQVKFVKQLKQVPEQATLAVWGSRAVDNLVLERKQIRLLRLEDGFLRSVGLGADLIRPLSWVIDGRGIYYDATKPSDLEYLLETTDFSAALVQRARILREQIVTHELTKYNVGEIAKHLIHTTLKTQCTGRKIILVPGQVETDASLALGAPAIRHNIALLQAVREDHPEAYLIYKPHPDVLAGLRAAGDNENQAEVWCDEIITDRAMGKLLAQVDEVHVLTSLAGFEALLRGKPVTCYGQPFYAGWGLTTDRMPISRRTRRLSLDELVAATLILYPTYISRSTQRYITAEQALAELLVWRASSAKELPHWRKAIRPLLRLTGRK